MKKLIFLFALVGFFMLGMQSVSAQWCFYVDYDDTECNCNTITAKKLSYYIYDLVTQNDVVSLTTIDLPTGVIKLEGSETILWDEQDRYYVYTRITYFDPTECCGGWDSYIADGDELTLCNVELEIFMD
jgi:hypothetical protein